MRNDKEMNEFHLNHSIERFEEQVETMAERLRRAADELERDAKHVVDVPDSSFKVSALERTSWIVNALNHLTQHLNGQDLMLRAADIDAARKVIAETEED